MDGWSKATKLDQHTSKSELSLTLQGLLFELHSGNLNTTNPVVSANLSALIHSLTRLLVFNTFSK